MKKLIITIATIIFFNIGLFAQWNGSIDSTWYNEQDKVFIINSPEQLAGLSSMVNNGTTFKGVTIQLANDIDLNGVQNKWTPIGNYNNPNAIFAGEIDGNGYSINNMIIEISSENSIYAGLVGFGLNCSIKNLTIGKGSKITATNIRKYNDVMNYVGGFIGKDSLNEDNVSIINCNNYCDINSQNYGHSIVGGLIGWVATVKNIKTIQIEKCTNYGELYSKSESGESKIGGLLGLVMSNLNIIESFNQGNINSYASYSAISAGLLAYTSNSVNISNCANYGLIKSILYNEQNESGYTGTSVSGGIIGETHYTLWEKQINSKMENCNNYGKIISDITMTKYPGYSAGYGAGIIALAHHHNVIIENCNNYSDVENKIKGAPKNKLLVTSGIVGVSNIYNLKISNSCNLGNITLKAEQISQNSNRHNTAGIIGIGSMQDSIINCYNAGNISDSSNYSHENRYVAGISTATNYNSDSFSIYIANCYNTGNIFSIN